MFVDETKESLKSFVALIMYSMLLGWVKREVGGAWMRNEKKDSSLLSMSEGEV